MERLKTGPLLSRILGTYFVALCGIFNLPDQVLHQLYLLLHCAPSDREEIMCSFRAVTDLTVTGVVQNSTDGRLS